MNTINQGSVPINHFYITILVDWVLFTYLLFLKHWSQWKWKLHFSRLPCQTLTTTDWWRPFQSSWYYSYCPRVLHTTLIFTAMSLALCILQSLCWGKLTVKESYFPAAKSETQSESPEVSQCFPTKLYHDNVDPKLAWQTQSLNAEGATGMYATLYTLLWKCCCLTSHSGTSVLMEIQNLLELPRSTKY